MGSLTVGRRAVGSTAWGSVAGRFTDADFPAVPYPGARPECSFVHLDGGGWPLTRAVGSSSGWAVGGIDLDAWLAGRDEPPTAERHAVLAYGSNACPSKITWLRAQLALPGPVVVLRVQTEGLAAVWAAGRRVVDEQPPAVLAAVPGVVETHGLWLATDRQLAVLDVCEGRGERYDLVRVRTGRVSLADGTVVEDVLAYVGASVARRPLLVDGAVARCADVPQLVATTLSGVPASGDGLDVDPVEEDGYPSRPRRVGP